MPAEPAAYRPVIVIPVYNHPATVEDVVRRLLSTGTPVLLVDDASDPPAQEACERCRAMGAGLVRRQSTGGRGASILTGFKAARQAGFTHALVFDAGGRHDPAAVGSFLELSRKHSNDLVCGYARTSSAYPARARLARRMADAGACLAALSLAPKDVMCCLRVYRSPPSRSSPPASDSADAPNSNSSHSCASCGWDFACASFPSIPDRPPTASPTTSPCATRSASQA